MGARTDMELFVFAVAAVVCLSGAIGVVASRNPVHAALSLVATLFGIAVLFIAQEANFLAAVQVIVYAGAVMVLFLFVLMLLGISREDVLHETIKGQRPAAAVLVVLLLAGVIWAIFVHPFRGPGVDLARVANNDNVRAIGQLLFTRYVFAFEATGLLLVVAAVGALVLGKRPARPPARDRAAREPGAGEPAAREQEPVP